MTTAQTKDNDGIALIDCDTSKGPIKLRLIRKWSPNGFDRAVTLFERHFYDNTHFFRTVPGFLVQFGLTYDPDQELRKLGRTPIPDDPQLDPPIEFDEGTISFAGGGKNSRTSQLFFSYGKNKGLGTQLWETPIGEVVEGMENVRNFYGGYGDMPPWGKGAEQQRIRTEGRKYMEDYFPLQDYFKRCSVVFDRVDIAVDESAAVAQHVMKRRQAKEYIDKIVSKKRSLRADANALNEGKVNTNYNLNSISVLSVVVLILLLSILLVRKRKPQLKKS